MSNYPRSTGCLQSLQTVHIHIRKGWMQIKQQAHNLPAVVCRRVAEEGHPEGKSELRTLGKCRDKEKTHVAKQSHNGGNLERKESPAS